jgi:hypothetical protein
MEITAKHSKAIGQCARIRVKEGLLLDGIALHSAHVAPGNKERAALVIADLANSRLAVRDRTAVPTGIAANPVPIELFVQVTLTDVAVNDVAKSGHSKPLTHSKPASNWE